LGILLGVEPGAPGVGRILVAAGGALTTIDAIGTAVGFSDCNEKEGEAVGVGKREAEMVVPETTVPEAGEEEEEEGEEEEDEEAADAART
jgi:hypothetical protein